MSAETLTPKERAYIQGFGTPESTKALRIIDQLTAALEAAEHDHHEQRESRKYWEQQHGVAWERAEALQARVAELEAQNAQAEQQLTAFGESTVRLLARAEAAESELADLRGRVARVMKVYPYFESDLEGTTLAVALEALRGCKNGGGS